MIKLEEYVNPFKIGQTVYTIPTKRYTVVESVYAGYINSPYDDGKVLHVIENNQGAFRENEEIFATRFQALLFLKRECEMSIDIHIKAIKPLETALKNIDNELGKVYQK